jgi:hypothetical protein
MENSDRVAQTRRLRAACFSPLSRRAMPDRTFALSVRTFRRIISQSGSDADRRDGIARRHPERTRHIQHT